jgi:hypothetical protein
MLGLAWRKTGSHGSSLSWPAALLIWSICESVQVWAHRAGLAHSSSNYLEVFVFFSITTAALLASSVLLQLKSAHAVNAKQADIYRIFSGVSLAVWWAIMSIFGDFGTRDFLTANSFIGTVITGVLLAFLWSRPCRTEEGKHSGVFSNLN